MVSLLSSYAVIRQNWLIGMEVMNILSCRMIHFFYVVASSLISICYVLQ